MTTVALPHGLTRRVAAVLVTLLAALGVVAATPVQALAGPSEGDFFSAANAARAANGVHALAWASDLADVARQQAERMAKADSLFHNPNLATDVSNWQVVSENVGYGPSWDSIQSAFMASPEHKANIVDPEVTQLGVGTYVGPDGRLWVSEVFRLPFGSTAPAATGSGSGSASAPAASSTSSSGGSSALAQPSPEQLLRDRIAIARDKVSSGPASRKDPLTEALAFSTVMVTVGG